MSENYGQGQICPCWRRADLPFLFPPYYKSGNITEKGLPGDFLGTSWGLPGDFTIFTSFA
jgi:hypothetical protein